MNVSLRQSWRRWAVLAPAAFLLIFAAPVGAATFGELYTVSVEPNPQAQDPRTDAIRRAMGLLLTRITGRQQAAAYPDLQDLINNAVSYLDQYAPLSSDEIRVGFRRSAVNQALTARNLPIWGDERPLTLVWIATDFGNGYRAELKASESTQRLPAGIARGEPSDPLLPDDAAFFDAIADEILTAADERGLPIVLPRLDAEDRAIVRFADVWGGFDEFVAQASERYNVDAVLIARIEATDAGPRVNWTVQRGDRRDFLLTPRARMGVDWLADEFASTFTTVGGARATWITIRDVRNWGDFARTLEYVRSVSIVESADPESLTGDELLLRVAARGDDALLQRYLTLDGRFIAEESFAGLVFAPAWVTRFPDLDAP